MYQYIYFGFIKYTGIRKIFNEYKIKHITSSTRIYADDIILNVVNIHYVIKCNNIISNSIDETIPSNIGINDILYDIFNIMHRHTRGLIAVYNMYPIIINDWMVTHVSVRHIIMQFVQS